MITDVGGMAIAQALRMNQSLRTLDLSFIGINVATATAIAAALRANTSLEVLNLDGNHNIGAAGGTAIAAALGVNRTLHTLKLDGDGVLVAGAMIYPVERVTRLFLFHFEETPAVVGRPPAPFAFRLYLRRKHPMNSTKQNGRRAL